MTDCPARIADGIDRLIAAIGRAVAWLALAIVLVQFAVVVLRYVFGIGSIWLTEIDHLRPRRLVHAGGGLDAAGRRPCAGRHLLRRRRAAHQGAGRPRSARLLLLLPFVLVLALVRRCPMSARSWAHPGALARNQRPAVRVPAQDAHPAVRACCSACRASRRRSAPRRCWRCQRPASLGAGSVPQPDD